MLIILLNKKALFCKVLILIMLINPHNVLFHKTTLNQLLILLILINNRISKKILEIKIKTKIPKKWKNQIKECFKKLEIESQHKIPEIEKKHTSKKLKPKINNI